METCEDRPTTINGRSVIMDISYEVYFRYFLAQEGDCAELSSVCVCVFCIDLIRKFCSHSFIALFVF